MRKDQINLPEMPSGPGVQLNCTRLHQIQQGTLANINNKFPSVFSTTVGTIKGYKAIICLKQGAKPIFKRAGNRIEENASRRNIRAGGAK